MTITIKNQEINYIQHGEGKDIVLLHGWGQNIEMMELLGRNFNNYRVTILDLPGHGESEEPKNVFTIYDYVEILEEFLKELNIVDPIVMGHSFGGRIAIVYSSRNNVSKLVLFGAPCVRNNKVSLKTKFLKTVKRLPGMNSIGEYAKKFIGSEDYRNASSVMRDTLVNIVNQDLSEEAKNIKCSTLMIWGTNDEAAPIEDARLLEELLADGALIELPGYTHYAYIEAMPQVLNILNSFLND